MILKLLAIPNDNTCYEAYGNVYDVVETLERSAKKLLKWFEDNQKKGSVDRCHLILRAGDSNQIEIRNVSIDSFLAYSSILCPLKTSENHRSSGVFRGYKMGTFARNWLKAESVNSLLVLNLVINQLLVMASKL